jgi:phosphoribosylanthranilate isomerase
VAKVGVFVDATSDLISQAVSKCGLTAVQLHGNETPEFCQRVSCDVIKAFRIDGPESLGPLRKYATSAWLLDSYVPGKVGGTGAQFKWELAVQANAWGCPILLAGGLTPENVRSAVHQVRPFGVDVSSGVESNPRKKDHAKVRAFIAAAKGIAD